MQTEKTRALAADKAGMDEKTARKYVKLGKMPSEVVPLRTWRTREDPFTEVWEEIKQMLSECSGFEAKTLFEYLQRRSPGRFSDGQVRTLQRRVKRWRALEGPAQEVFFPQLYQPGELCASDFTHMTELGITVGGERFEHMVYHLVLPYSNWETGTVCFSESFESLSEGLQNALWELGGVPGAHRSDRLTAAVQKTASPEEFTARYRALLRHYGLEGRKTNPNSPHENGDTEQRHHRLKRTVEQALLLRGSRDFRIRAEYETFLRMLFRRMNSSRMKRLGEELPLLHRLPTRRLEACKREHVRVGPSSTIRAGHNTYSVHSRLMGEMVEARLHAEEIMLYYGGQCVETLPRLIGRGGHRIQYRHIIDWLVRKPGAFENFRYRGDLFPTHRFRVAYDQMRSSLSAIGASKAYLAVLELAALEGEGGVDRALERLLAQGEAITAVSVREELARTNGAVASVREVTVAPVDLSVYDELLEGAGVSA
jgi:hypothetical protein